MFKSFFCYGVRLRTKSIITFRIVCFSCVKQQKMPATNEMKMKFYLVIDSVRCLARD